MKEFCPKCMSETDFEEIQEEFENTNIVITWHKCTRCGETVTDGENLTKLSKELKERVLNDLKLEQSLRHIGNSLGLIIPNEIVKKLHLKNKQKVELFTSGRRLIVDVH